MKKHLYLSAIVLLLITACASLGVPSPTTFNEKEAAAISTVTAIRGTALSLLQSGKITAEDAQNIQGQADNAREAIVVADQIHAANPEAGGDRLTAIVAGLTAIQAYLATRGH
jgi:uncharacterized lipoprotein YmbA